MESFTAAAVEDRRTERVVTANHFPSPQERESSN